LHASDDQDHLSFSCYIIEPILFKLISYANPLNLKDKMCHSLNPDHSEDFGYLTLSLRKQMIVSHEYGSSLGELLLK